MSDDPIADMLRDISDTFNGLGGSGRLVLEIDWPVTVTLGDGRVYKTTARVQWTEHGPKIVDSEGQARRIAQEVESSSPEGDGRSDGG